MPSVATCSCLMRSVKNKLMTQAENIARHFLYPGTLFADRREHLISTVLGSCVAVCLWDAEARMGGMNHFMLPLWNGEGLATPKYGNIAMERLLARLLAIGCRRENLAAKLFGGANVTSNGSDVFMIGDRNIMLARQMLEDFSIPVVACDLGGHCGRKIIMNSANGIVRMARGGSKMPSMGKT